MKFQKLRSKQLYRFMRWILRSWTWETAGTKRADSWIVFYDNFLSSRNGRLICALFWSLLIVHSKTILFFKHDDDCFRIFTKKTPPQNFKKEFWQIEFGYNLLHCSDDIKSYFNVPLERIVLEKKESFSEWGSFVFLFRFTILPKTINNYGDVKKSFCEYWKYRK